MSKEYICQEPQCNLQILHGNHTCFKIEELGSYYNQLFNQNIILDDNFFLTQIQILKETLDKIKTFYQTKLLIHQEQYALLFNEYQKQSPNWKLLAQNVEIGQNGFKLKIDSAEILIKIGDLLKLCQNIYNQNKTTQRLDSKLKIKINTPTESQTVEEEIQFVEIRAKQQEIISVGNESEKKIILLQYIEPDSCLILFENNSLANYNLSSKCLRQKIINCQKFYYFENKLGVQYNNILQLYNFDQKKKIFNLIEEFQVKEVIWFQLRGQDIIYQKENLYFYKSLLQNNYSEIELLQQNSNFPTINYLLGNKLALFINRSFKVYDLQFLQQIEWELKINDNIQEIKQNSKNYLVLIGYIKFYMISMIKQQIVRIFNFEEQNSLIIPSPSIPYLFLISNRGSIYESKTYFHNTKQQLFNITSQYPTAIFMDNQAILIGDDLGFIQKFKCSLGE
ncbi:unnamed protein product [Paramecium sonneborni]|uniref:Uncharacterized protein n=1 Tax=Paramecium sonneborni TaxID=65129 RepID=A0A8S1QRH2_9CILI|nr:unnamed protein product [Paramecium sonneborni]